MIIWLADVYKERWAELWAELKRHKIDAQLEYFKDVRHDMLKKSGPRPDFIFIDLAAIDMPVNLGHDPMMNYHSAILHLTDKWSSAVIAMYSGINSYAEDCVKELRELTGREDLIWIDLNKGLYKSIVELVKAFM